MKKALSPSYISTKFIHYFTSVLALIDKLVYKTAFSKVVSYHNELKKIDLIRILFGLLLCARSVQTLRSVLILHSNPDLVTPCFCILAVYILFTLGIFTPLMGIMIILGTRYVDRMMSFGTLGVFVSSMLTITLLLANTGKAYSIDSWIMKKKNLVSNFLQKLYLLFGAQTKEDISRAYCLGFILYASISFTAMVFHLNDETWIRGLTTKSLFTSSFLCNGYSFFRSFDFHFPRFFSFLSISAAVFQIFFQFSMIPMVFTKFGTKFVFYWGVLFFTLSLLFINLSHLPHVEILLWFLIFVPTIAKKKNVLSIVYDDKCNLCRNTINFLSNLNLNETLKFMPLSTSSTFFAKYGILREEAQKYMFGFRNDSIYKGYELYLKISKTNFIYWPLFPVLLMGKLFGIGPAIYNLVARNRTKVIKNCKLNPSSTDNKKIGTVDNKFFQPLITSAIYYVYIFSLISFFLFEIPFLNLRQITKNKTTPKYISTLNKYIGLDSPNVFNKIDLCTGDNWMEIYSNDEGQWNLTPITGLNGERLSYEKRNHLLFSNYNSDLLYFGTVLRFRRQLLHIVDSSEKLDDFLFKGLGRKTIERRIKYDYNWNRYKGSKKYLIKIQKNAASNISYNKPDKNKYITKTLREFIYEWDGKKLTLTTKN